MAGFLYFVPEPKESLVRENKIDRGVLARYGLGEVLSDVQRVPDDCVVVGVQCGPDGYTGAVLVPVPISGKTPEVLGYYPDKQEWTITDGGAYLGHAGNVLSADLLRKRVHLGYWVMGDDGQSWLVPVARSTDESRVTLPAFVVFDNGKPRRRIKKRFAQLWDLAGEYLKRVAGHESLADSEEWRINAAVEALTVNYRIGRSELTVLADMEISPLDTQTVEVILKSLVDEQIVIEAKKNETKTSSPPAPNGGDTDVGNGDCSAATHLVGAN